MTLIEVNRLMLERLALFVNQIPDADYCKPLSVYNGSSLGEHTRHIIEFYQCLLSQAKSGTISYDLRERSQALQQHTQQAQEALMGIIALLDNLEFDKELVLEVNPHTSDEAPQRLQTNLQRELHYVLDHTIHHMALIKIGVYSALPNIKLPTDFGVAPSTLRSRAGVAG